MCFARTKSAYAQGHVIRQINAEGGITDFTYNNQGQLRSLTDPVGNTTSYEYDEQGRLVKETNELGKSRSFEYLFGNVVAKKTDRNNRVISFEYDDFGQPVTEKWHENNKIVKTFMYAYDESGQMVSVDDGVTKFDYVRDEDGRELSAAVTLPGLQNPVLQVTEYDALGRRTRIETAFGTKTDFANDYTYTKTGQVASITQGTKRADYAYDASGMRTKTRLTANGKEAATVAQAYDDMGRLENIVQKHGAQTIAEYLYSWDVANRITEIQFSDDKVSYGYDTTSQLTSANYEKLPPESYQYDANGNRKNFVTGKNNQLTNDGVFKYTYDNEGNRIAKVSKTSRTEYFWDHRNRLVKVVADGKPVEYVYDYKNRLVKRNDELFVHDGWQIACSLKNGKVEHRYLWGAKQDELLCENGNWTLCDHLGTVRDIVNAKGKVVSHLEYNAFGKLISVSGIKPRFRYTGKLFDDVTGLQWNINRWYDANAGRWASEEPIGFISGGRNMNCYGTNSPIIAIDPLGLVTLTIRTGTDKLEWSDMIELLDPVTGMPTTKMQNRYIKS